MMGFVRWLRIALFLLALGGVHLDASDHASRKVIRLEGYLSKEKLLPLNTLLGEIAKNNTDLLIVEIDSTSGNLNEVLSVAKQLYQVKSQGHLQFIVYIDDNAVGPAAILPLMADEVYTSNLVSWGDIPLGTNEALPTNILRSKVIGLIPTDSPKYKLLSTAAWAMSGPDLVTLEGNELSIVSKKDQVSSYQLITGNNETLVLNQNQLKILELTKKAISLTAFRDLFNIEGSEKLQLEETSKQMASPALAVAKKLNEELEKQIKFNSAGPNTVGHILIDDRTSGINQSTWIYVKTALDYYKKTKPAFVILELNTPGGEVFSAQQISDALKELDTNSNIPVIAFIDNWAISAGAMLAYSCRFIATVKDGSMGAAEPVIMGEKGEMTSASEKVNSAIRTDFANRARFFDRNPDIAEAMVDKDMILVLRHGKIVKLDKEDQINLKGPDPDKVITTKGKLLTLNSQEMIEYGVADMLFTPVKLEPITEAEKAAGSWPLSKTLFSEYAFFKNIPNAQVDSFRMDWKTHFFAFLATPIVSSLLMLGLLLGFYMEMSSPGVSLPGAIAVICLILIIISNLSLEIASWFEVILMLIGLGLVVLELVFFHSAGFLGIVGAVLFIIGLFMMMLPGIGSVNFEFDTQTFNAAGQEVIARLGWLSGTLILAIIIMAILSRYISPSFRGLNRLVLSGHEQEASEGYIAGENPAELPPVGSKGEALSILRPSGKVIIQGRIYEAVTPGSFIAKGEKIKVEKLDGSVIVVNKDEEEIL